MMCHLVGSMQCSKCRATTGCGLLMAALISALYWCALCTIAGAKYTFTIDEGANGQDSRISVNYDGFIDDVSALQRVACNDVRIEVC